MAYLVATHIGMFQDWMNEYVEIHEQDLLNV